MEENKEEKEEPIENITMVKEEIEEEGVKPIIQVIGTMSDDNNEGFSEPRSGIEKTQEIQTAVALKPLVTTTKISRKKRCHKGSRRNKKTHHCKKTGKNKRKRCHKGSRRGKKSHRCRKEIRLK